MPLAGYGVAFIEASERCGLDPYLLPAIAVKESSGGKHYINNNPFGYGSRQVCNQDGCYTTLAAYESFENAIDAVGYQLCENRFYKGRNTREILWNYNGAVEPQYPDRVISIMADIENGE